MYRTRGRGPAIASMPPNLTHQSHPRTMLINRSDIALCLGDPLYSKYDAFIGATDLTEEAFSELTVRILKTKATVNVSAPTPASASRVISMIKI